MPARKQARSSSGTSGQGTKRKMVFKEEPVKKVKLNRGDGVKKRVVKQLGMPVTPKQNVGGKVREIYKVIGRRRTKLNSNGKKMVEYMIRWKGLGPDHDTWMECKSGVFESSSTRALIGEYLSTLRANTSRDFKLKSRAVILDLGDGTAKTDNPQTIYIKQVHEGAPPFRTEKKNEQRKTRRTASARNIEMPSVCDEVADKWAQAGRSNAAQKAAKKVVSKIKSSKAQAVKALHRKQHSGKNKDTRKTKTISRKKNGNEAKGKRQAKTQVDRLKTIKSQVKTARSDSASTIEGAVSSSSSDSGLLYSLDPDFSGAGEGRKSLFLDMAFPKTCESSTGTPDTDPEISFKGSPRKRMLLKDSIRPKSETGIHGIELVTPATPASHPSPYRTPPSSPGGTGPSIQTPPLANRATTAMAEVVPSSPAAATYMKNITTTMQQQKKKSGAGSDSCSTNQERQRVSVRQSEGAFKYKEIVVKKCAGYTQIWLYSQTQAKNALNPAVIAELLQVLHNAKYDDTRVVLLSGSGNTFCSGVDLHYLTEGGKDPRQRAQKMADAVRDFTQALITFPKPIMVAVNGPAVGLGVAMLPLCDIVYASDKATFHCPYGRLGQTPEGASSYTFPAGLGLAMANDLLLAGRRLTATQAMQTGLVSQVFWPTSMMSEVVSRLLKMTDEAAATPAALELSKMLVRGPVKAKLQVSNDSETAVLAERWMAPDCQKLMRTYVDEEQHLFL